ncbi:MAG: AAA family ATPase [Firmicutes bacterium]|nr:AAA family ATPase [Bacillota bacterium]
MDHFKIFGDSTRITNYFMQEAVGRKRYVFIFDEGVFCENAFALGFAAIFIRTEEQLNEIKATLKNVPTWYNNAVILPCCHKFITDGLAEVIGDNPHFVKNAWSKLFTRDRQRDYYLCNPNEFEKAIIGIAKSLESGNAASLPVDVRFFTDIEVKETSWLWYPYIARGCITILYAAPGTGKTFFTCWLAAQLSNAAALPGAVPERWEKPASGATMFFNAEDPAERTLKPRLIGCNANLKAIVTVEDWENPNFVPYSLTDPRLPMLFESIRPSLVVFDPLQSYIGAEIDMHRANQTRPMLAHINALAAKYNFAALIVCHINKMTSQDIGDRIIGSQDIKGAARSVLFLGQHPDGADIKVMFQIKNNLERWGDPIAFKVTENEGYAGFEADETIDVRDLSPERCSGSTTGRAKVFAESQRSMAEEIVTELFAEREKIPSSELKETAKANEISWKVFHKELAKVARWRKGAFKNGDGDTYVKIIAN